jgi:hypothetical protein
MKPEDMSVLPLRDVRRRMAWTWLNERDAERPSPWAVPCLSFLVCFTVTAFAMAQERPSETKVIFETTRHFLASEGGDIVVPPGTYRVEQGAESRLHLRPAEGQEPLIIQAEKTSHDEELTTAVALTVKGEGGDEHLLLLLPDKTGLVATGSSSEVRTRGAAIQLLAPKVPSLVTMLPQARVLCPAPALAGGPQTPFTLLAIPALVTPGSPYTISGPDGLTFTWKPAQGAQCYKLCLQGVGLKCDQPGAALYPSILGTSYTLPPGHGVPSRFQGTRFYWTVASCTTDGCGDFAHVNALAWYFPATGPPSAAPGLVSPADNVLVSYQSGTFVWSSVADAMSYKLCITEPGVACGTGTSQEWWVSPSGTNTVTTTQAFPDRFVQRALSNDAIRATLTWSVAACKGQGPGILCTPYQQNAHRFWLAARSLSVRVLDQDGGNAMGGASVCLGYHEFGAARGATSRQFGQAATQSPTGIASFDLAPLGHFTASVSAPVGEKKCLLCSGPNAQFVGYSEAQVYVGMGLVQEQIEIRLDLNNATPLYPGAVLLCLP